MRLFLYVYNDSNKVTLIRFFVTSCLHCVQSYRVANGHVHLAYNPSYSAYFFSRNSIFLSQKISQQYFSAGL
jgi:hypothetical protein